MNTILNIFTPVYSWCTALSDRLTTQDDFISYYKNYFEGTSVCSNVFLVAVCVAAAIACFYYFVCCNLSFASAKRYIWVMVLALSFLTTLCITPHFIVGHYDEKGLVNGDSNTRLFLSAKETLADILQNIYDEETMSEVIANAEDYAKQFRGIGKQPAFIAMFMSMDEKIPLQMSLLNGVYSMLIFTLLSIIFKRFTTHGKAIPF
ncbi:MAG: hypothetical protein IJ756_07430 [Paludibacteraceae bacterium]|nr:hypothetical protein [Paludibacteraceae bacterium]